MTVSHQYLDINAIELDRDNPRIAPDVSLFTEPPDDEFLQYALNPGDAKFNELKQAIVTNDGIINPIIVNHVDGKWIVIEGNTRLTIYRQLHQEEPEDERWKKIPDDGGESKKAY